MTTEELLSRIEILVNLIINQKITERKLDVEKYGTSVTEFERMYMAGLKGDELLPHTVFRSFIKYLQAHEDERLIADANEALSKIRYITANPEHTIGEGEVRAIVKNLVLTGAGILPESTAYNPIDIEFDFSKHIIFGQIAYNLTDDKWYYLSPTGVKPLMADVNPESLEEINAAIINIHILLGNYIEKAGIEYPFFINVNDKLALKFDPNTLEIDENNNLRVKSELGTYLSTAIPESFTNANLADNKLIIDHYLKTENVNLIIWDNLGNKLDVPWKTEGIDQVIADFGSPIEEGLVYRYVLVFWNNQSIGLYPDPTYSLSGHIHDDRYSLTNHVHDNLYASENHNHHQVYSKLAHNHTGVYAPATHRHDSDYQAKGYYFGARFVGSINGITGDLTILYNPAEISVTAVRNSMGVYTITHYWGGELKYFVTAYSTMVSPQFSVKSIIRTTNNFKVTCSDDHTPNDCDFEFKIEIWS